jgi:hypothetical protein
MENGILDTRKEFYGLERIRNIQQNKAEDENKYIFIRIRRNRF